MIVHAKEKLFVTCPSCKEHDFAVDQIKVGQTTGSWACPKCHNYFDVTRCGARMFELTSTGEVETPVTVTLKSVTEPPIFLTLNAWKYPCDQKVPKEQYVDHQRYFYDEHTCPTNFLSQVERISFNGDNDPHGVFEFVSVVDGHFKDPNVIE